MSTGYAVASQSKRPRLIGANSIKRANQRNQMKLSFKDKLRNWLMDTPPDMYAEDIESHPSISSNGFRLNIYGASGGTIVETTKYDRVKDDNRHSLHVVTDDKDLGAELAKIITMEQLR